MYYNVHFEFQSALSLSRRTHFNLATFNFKKTSIEVWEKKKNNRKVDPRALLLRSKLIRDMKHHSIIFAVIVCARYLQDTMHCGTNQNQNVQFPKIQKFQFSIFDIFREPVKGIYYI